MCWWTGSDVYEEWGFRHLPYHCGYGLVNLQGIPKPSAHAHHFAHLLDGGKIVREFAQDGRGYLWVKKGREDLLMFWNWIHPEAAPTEWELDLAHAGFKPSARAKIMLVDDAHANGKAAWEKLGCPAELSPRAESQIRRAAEVVEQPLPKAAARSGKLRLGPNAFGVISD